MYLTDRKILSVIDLYNSLAISKFESINNIYVNILNKIENSCREKLDDEGISLFFKSIVGQQ